MAHLARDFEGWSYSQNIIPLSSDDEEPGTNIGLRTSSRNSSRFSSASRSRRPRKAVKKTQLFRDDPSNIVLKRAEDDLEFTVGDCVLYNNDFIFDQRQYQDGEDCDPKNNTVMLIKKISLHTDDYVEVVAAWFYQKTNFDELNKSVKVKYHDRNEVLLTPFLQKISLKSIITKVHVYSLKDYKDKKLTGNKTGKDYVCLKACDTYNLNLISEEFDYNEMLETLFENEVKFSQTLNTFLPQAIDPMSASSPRKSTPKKLCQKVVASKSPKISKSPKKPAGKKKRLQLSTPKKTLPEPVSPNETSSDLDEPDAASSEYEDEDFLESSDSSIELISDDDFEENLKSMRKKRITRRGRKPTKPAAAKRQKTGPKVRKSVKDTTPRIPSRVVDLDAEDSDVLEVVGSDSPKKKDLSSNANKLLFENAKEQLHTSALLASLPCREEEFAQIYLTLESLIMQEMGSCLYISGTPGTGKTATVRKVINELLTRKKHSIRQQEVIKEIELLRKEKEKPGTKRKAKKQRLRTNLKKAQAIEIDSDDTSKPGTTILQDLEKELEKYEKNADEKSYEYINKFDYVEINGLKLISPNDCYELLWEKISGSRVSANSAKNLIENYLAENETDEADKRAPLIILMDEIDQIITKNQSIMYNFFNWPTYNNCKFIVIAIANTMDLPERVLTNKISSRLGLSRLLFPGYSHDQLSKIIETRLQSMNQVNVSLQKALKFETSAIEFASRKVASVSGDARRGLSICRRAVEIAEAEYVEEIRTKRNEGSAKDGVYYVKINHIIRAIQETTNSPTALYVMNLPIIAKIFLVSILRRQKFTGFSENELTDLIDEMKRIISMNFLNTNNPNFKSVLIDNRNFFDSFYGNSNKSSQFMGLNSLVGQLVDAGVVTQEDNKATQSKLVKLCLAEDEIHNALRREKAFQKILG